MIKIGVSGVCGRTGSRIARVVLSDEELKLACALEREGHPALGKDIGAYFGMEDAGVEIKDSLTSCIEEIGCLIEFSAPEATLSHLEIMKENSKSMVIGTTGLSPDELARVESASKKIPIVMSPNMGVGVNLLFWLTGILAEKTGSDYDVEITETHHRFKKDAPSGTAKKLAEIIAKSKKKKLDEIGVYGRKGATGERPKDEIGIHAIRAGDVAGEHTVIFAGKGERIELTHKAHTRDIFARGAVEAARFVCDKAPGLYTMSEVLDIDG